MVSYGINIIGKIILAHYSIAEVDSRLRGNDKGQVLRENNSLHRSRLRYQYNWQSYSFQ